MVSERFAVVAEWQTRRLQVPVVAISCGFKSHQPHKYLGFDIITQFLKTFKKVKITVDIFSLL